MYLLPLKSNGKGFILLSRATFPKADRIRTSIEYKMLYKDGSRHIRSHFIFVFRKNQFSISRLGITVSKKVGKAVTRNRIKRIIREYFRLNKGHLSDCLDINIIARPLSGNIGAAEIREHLDVWFETIGRKAKL